MPRDFLWAFIILGAMVLFLTSPITHMHKVIALLFFIFAAVQYNDPDAWIWVPIYIMVSVVAILFDRGWRNRNVMLGICTLYFVGMCFYIPDVMHWVRDGAPTITGSMKAESPFIEFVREFFGLAICLAATTWYLRATSKASVSR